MSRADGHRLRRLALIAGAILVMLIAAGAVVGYGVVRGGWFDSDSVTGSTEGFRPDAGPGAAPERRPNALRRRNWWAEYGRTRTRTRAAARSRVGPPFRRLWQFDAGSLVEFPPVVARDRLVVSTNHGLGIALDPSTGRELWRIKLRGRSASSPALFKDLAIFTTLRGEVVVVDSATGAPRWRFNAGSPIESSALVTDGSVYFGTLDGRVIRLSLATRRPVWVARATGDVKAGLALNRDMVVVGDYGGNVSAFARTDGTLRWRTTSPGTALQGAGRFYGGAGVAYGRVFIGNINGRVLALDARTGEVAWVRVVDDFVYSSPAIADETIYVGSYDHHLYALDAVTGEVRWRTDAGERISGSPSVIGPLVYASTIAREPSEGRTFAVDRRSGEVVWSFPDGRYSPAVVSEGLMVITGVRTLYGFRPR